MTSMEKCGEADHVTTTEVRDVAPANFVLKIKSFSLFTMNDVEKYESRDFKAGGYECGLTSHAKNTGQLTSEEIVHHMESYGYAPNLGLSFIGWFKYFTGINFCYCEQSGVWTFWSFVCSSKIRKLILYPSGDKSRNGEDHVSIYLAASGESPFQFGGEIHASVRFCLYDQNRNRYLTEQGRVMRFHALKTEWGVPRYMPLETFKNPSNGYLVDDTCVFGVEVFVIKSSGVGECLTLKGSQSYTHEWKIPRLSSLGSEYRHSDVFTVGGHKWKVWLYPRGNLLTRDQSLSIFLLLVDPDKSASGQKVITRFTFRLKDRNKVVYHQRGACTTCLSSSQTNWGWPAFMPLEKVRECLADDSFIVEAEVAVLGTASKWP